MHDRVSTDLQALIEFRNHLSTFNRNLEQDFTRIMTHWRDVGDIWQDRKYEEFGTALTEAHSGISRYLAVAEEHELHLARFIDAVQAVLDTQLR